MLNFFSPQAKTNYCDGVDRRQFLRLGALGIGGLTLADLLRSDAAAGSSAGRPKSVIMINLSGGPSHIDMYDLKPLAPVEYRGNFQPIQTKVPGLDICELMPRQAEIADKFALIRNMKFRNTGHSPPELLTGFLSEDRPALGSVVSRLEADTGRLGKLPPYVSLDRHAYPSYLGATHKPFTPGDNLSNLTISQEMTPDRLADRKNLLASFDTLRRDLDDAQGNIAALDRFTAQALEMVTSSAARDAFDVSREPQSVQDRYGVMKELLRARRLVEAGVRVVQLSIQCRPYFGDRCSNLSWDFHVDGFQSLETILPHYDQALAALISDLDERGLSDDVTVVVWGEMGRTPLINKNAGRDHWPQSGFALLVGGGLKMGQVIGATDDRAGEPAGEYYTPQNVLSTIYFALGIDLETTLPNRQGRPMYLLDDRRRVTELV